MKIFLKYKKPKHLRPWLSGWTLLIFVLVSCGTGTPTAIQETVTKSEGSLAAPTATEAPRATPTAAVSPTTEDPVQMQVEAEDLAGIVVRFAHTWVGEMAEVMETAAREFSMTNPWDIWVEVDAPGNELALLEVLGADLDSGDLPGLIVVYPDQLAAFNGQLLTTNLSPYWSDPTWGLTADERADIPGMYLAPFGGEAALSALPIAPQATVLFYNRAWAESLGFSAPPQDDQAFRRQMCEAAFANNADEDQENDGTGGWLVDFDPRVLASWFEAFGGTLPTTGSPRFNSDAGETAFGYLKSVFDQGCFWEGRRPEGTYYFAHRYALAVAATLDQIPNQRSWLAEAGNDDDWIVIGFPGSENETMMIDSPGLMLTVDTPENQLAAWLFARHLLSPEVQADLARAGYRLPVRQSALPLLADFSAENPQWTQAIALLDGARPLPGSEGWSVGQWVLQDAIFNLMKAVDPDLPAILKDLDAMIEDLEGATP